MFTSATIASSDGIDLSNDALWNTLYPPVHALARYLVKSFPVSSWRGQEEDIADDIVQEAMRRVFEHSRKAERGEVEPIHALKKLLNVVAYNYYRDLRRRERRLTRVSPGSYLLSHHGLLREQTQAHLLDAVTEQVEHERLFGLLAAEIGRFPRKQKGALLTDLANRMYFDVQPTALQKAFLQAGIDLQQYRRSLPSNPRERSRHISLLSQAYKRVAHLAIIRAQA